MGCPRVLLENTVLNSFFHFSFWLGNRDRGGRAVVQVYMKKNAWLSEQSRINELTQLLVYFYNIPRYEAGAT